MRINTEFFLTLGLPIHKAKENRRITFLLKIAEGEKTFKKGYKKTLKKTF
jgi:hypothetical protein